MTRLLLFLLFVSTASASDTWTRLPDVPDARGFAGAFGGVMAGSLVVAGGTHFTDKMPWEGGVKVWYDTIYTLSEPNGLWRASGRLPRPNGYGVSVTTPSGMLIAGGGNAAEHYREVFWLHGKDKLPPLPRACAFMSGCVLDEVLYIASGIEIPTATQAMDTFWSLDLKKAVAWQLLPPCPGGPRILSTMASVDGRVFLLSGASLHAGKDGKPERDWLRDAWCYTPASRSWQKLPDLPRVAVAAPSPAPVKEGRIYLLGGDDGTKAAFEPKSAHPGFPRDILSLDVNTLKWSKVGDLPFSLVTSPSVLWKGQIILPGGESRPGVRSPQVWSLDLEALATQSTR